MVMLSGKTTMNYEAPVDISMTIFTITSLKSNDNIHKTYMESLNKTGMQPNKESMV